MNAWQWAYLAGLVVFGFWFCRELYRAGKAEHDRRDRREAWHRKVNQWKEEDER